MTPVQAPSPPSSTLYPSTSPPSLHTQSNDPSRRILHYCFPSLLSAICPLKDLPKILTVTDNHYGAYCPAFDAVAIYASCKHNYCYDNIIIENAFNFFAAFGIYRIASLFLYNNGEGRGGGLIVWVPYRTTTTRLIFFKE